MIVVIMGAAGAGKSSVAGALAIRFGWPFIEGDLFHAPANIEKMVSGHALDDEDRRGWLAAITRQIAQWRRDGLSGVIACSALKRAYRDQLRTGDPDCAFVYLRADENLLLRRVSQRSGHFMPPQLIASQLETLQPPGPDERAIVLNASERLEALIDKVAEWVSQIPE